MKLAFFFCSFNCFACRSIILLYLQPQPEIPSALYAIVVLQKWVWVRTHHHSRGGGVNLNPVLKQVVA